MMWDCQTFEERLYAYLDGVLTEEETACFLQHSNQCSACRQVLAEAQAFETGMQQLLALVQPPPDFTARVMAALPKAESASIPAKIVKFRKKRVFGGLGAVAAAAVLVLGITALGPNTDQLVTPVQPGVNVADVGNLPNQPAVNPPGPGDENTEQQPADDDQTTPAVTQPKPKQTDGQTTKQPADSGQAQAKPNTAQPNQVADSGQTDTGEQEQPVTSGVFSLPKAAYGVQAEGTLASRLLASFETDSIYAPKFSNSGDSVYYYTQDNDEIYMWRSSLSNPAEPECLGLAKNPDSTVLAQLPKNSCPIYDVNTTLFSPDRTMLAMNLRGAETGVWIASVGKEQTPWQLCGEGGGQILAWSPNGSKLLFTDKDGKLYVGYPVEKRIFTVSENVVKDLAWASDSKTVVMTVQENGTNKTSLYTVQIP